MSRTRYFRTSDGANVTQAEACNSNGTVRDGYSVGVSRVFAEGDYMSFDINLVDAAAANGAASVFFADASFTDAERTFADSAEGKSALALARADFAMSEAHKGSAAAAWTADHEAGALRSILAQCQRHGASVQDARQRASSAAAAELTAHTTAAEALNAWRK